jgi:salicylate hydroxylase
MTTGPVRRSVGIAGAGIGGLTCALACATAGHDVVVYEQAAGLVTAGAGIQLGPNATRLLRTLGVDAGLAAVAVSPSAIRLRAFDSGRCIAERPLGEAHAARYGAPYYALHRLDLVAELARAATARGADVRFARGVVDAGGAGAGTSGGASLVLDGGDVVHHDVVVGADGIHSATRRALAAAAGDASAGDAATFMGCVAYRALVPAATLPAPLQAPVVTAWLGPGAHVVHYPVAAGRLVNVIAVHEGAAWRDESWQQIARPAEMRAAFAGWHADVDALLAGVDACSVWALHARPVFAHWQRGRIALLGDACHPILPFLAQGAAMAIEDACVLAAAIGAGDLERALAGYERTRTARVHRVAATSRAHARLFHRRNPLAVLARDALLGLGSRWLPALALRQFDWLYAHDALRR